MPDINYRLPYWQNGSEELKEVVKNFLNHIDNQFLGTAGIIQAPTEAQFITFRQYILAWMNFTGWKIKDEDESRFMQLKTTAAALTSFPDTKIWLNSALYFGIDPF